MASELTSKGRVRSRTLDNVVKLFLLGSFAAPAAAAAVVPQGGPEIREFVASNAGTLLDEDQDSSDWIEIRNTAATPVNLFGFHLTDDASNLVKWKFPAKVLNPGDYLVVFASGKNRVNPNAPLHTNFSLSALGEYLALVAPNGAIASQYSPAYPPQKPNISYGLTEDTNTAAYFTPPTPGAANGPPYLLIPDVHFSHKRGFYDAPFALALTNSQGGAQIRYTLDGTAPSEASGLTYTAPIVVNKGTLVRAVAILPGTNYVSSSVTSTYLFPQEILTQTNASAIAMGFPAQWVDATGTDWTAWPGHPGASYGFDPAILADYSTAELVEALKSLPSISLVMPKDDWFSYSPPTGPFGIYVNSTQTTEYWDRACSAEWISPGGGAEFQVNCGVGIQGASSTGQLLRGQLSLMLKFKGEFGPPELEFPVFPGGGVQSFDRLILDSGNQDSIYCSGSAGFKLTRQFLRDAFLTELQFAMGGHAGRGRFVHVYLNGLYWGVYYLHERPDHDWGAATFGGDADEYDWIKQGSVMAGNSNPADSPYGPGAWPYSMTVTWLGLDIDSTIPTGENSYALIQKYVDLPKYCDYLLVNYYGCNTDWPSHNWYATAHARLGPNLTDVNPEPKFLFHVWDAEDGLPISDEAVYGVGGFFDRTILMGAWPGDATFIRGQAAANSDFQILFADRAHKQLFNDGPLYVKPGFEPKGTPYDPAHPERNRPASLYHDLAQSVDRAIVLEFARWMNYFYPAGTFKANYWGPTRDLLLTTYFPGRSGGLLAQLRNSGLYPTLDAPAFSQHGGIVNYGFPLSITVPPTSTVYVTLDGTDPRLSGGAIHPTAQVYSAPIPIVNNSVVKARAFRSGIWSALEEAVFTVETQLRISEFMADNKFTLADESGEFEDWVELYNGGTVPVSLTGMYLSDDPGNPKKFQFTNAISVPPGGHVLIWCDEELGEGPMHANVKLSKSGESVILTHTDLAGNITLDSVDFGAQLTDVSWARIPESGPFLSLLTPTPGWSNAPGPGQVLPYDAKNASSSTTQLGIPGTPKLGQNLTLQVSNCGPSSPGVVFFGLEPASFAIPFEGTLLMGAVHSDAIAPYLTSPAGAASVSIAVPNLNDLLGVLLTAQSYTVSGKLSNAVAFELAP